VVARLWAASCLDLLARIVPGGSMHAPFFLFIVSLRFHALVVDEAAVGLAAAALLVRDNCCISA